MANSFVHVCRGVAALAARVVILDFERLSCCFDRFIDKVTKKFVSNWEAVVATQRCHIFW